MPTELAIWRMDDTGQPRRMRSATMPLERDLEDVIVADPDILGEPILLIGRQVPTAHGGFVDLLGVDGEGSIRVLELKRDRTPREVIAQALDYASWAATLSHAQILRNFADFRAADDDTTFEAAFEARFGIAAPEELNVAHRVTIVAARLDEATERIVGYLADLGVPVNAVFFHYYEDGGNQYLARTWLRDEAKVAPAPRSGKSSTREPWNGRDWYSSFGEDGTRSWDDARTHGFVSAGGGKWFSQGLRRPRLGDRVSVYIPKVGYVGVGEVGGEPAPFSEATVGDGTVRLADQELVGTYRHAGDESDPDLAEYVLPIRWLKTVDRADAVRKPGIFASQHPMCRLSSATTLAVLETAFAADEAAPG